MRGFFVVSLVFSSCTASFDRSRIPGELDGPTEGAASRPGGFETCEVTTLDDSGPGSLRSCMVEGREISFGVSGTIMLASELDVPSYVTVRGETAPDGISLTRSGGQATIFELDEVQDIIVRELHLLGRGRDVSGGLVTMCRTSRALLHRLVIRSARTGMSLTGADSDIALVDNLFAESNTGVNLHAFSGGCESTNHMRITVARNLFHRVNERAPRFAGATTRAQVVNNVVYGWHWFESGDSALMLEDLDGNGAFPSEIDIVGNAWIAAAASPPNRAVTIVGGVATSSVYTEDNRLPAGEELTGTASARHMQLEVVELETVLDGVGSDLSAEEQGWVDAVRAEL